MKKATIMKKGAAFTLAAMMAMTVYAPAAAFAGEAPEDAGSDTPQTTEQEAPAPTPAPAPQQSAPAPAPAPQQSAEPAAPAAEQSAAPQQAEPEAPQQAEEQNVSDDQAQAAEEQAPATEESQYGEATGAWGYGNSTQTTRWDEYTKDGETILVFKSTGESDSDEENAVTELLDENGKSLKEELKKRVTQVVFETGITGIGWTALYDSKNYEPLYTSEYTVDRTKTDLFKDFTKLTTVVPCETIKRIGWSAFRKCGSLKEFDFTKCPQLEEIMNQAFNECKSLNNVDLSNCNALSTIAWSAFKGAGKGADASLALPTDGVLSIIGGYAFYEYANKNSKGTDVDFSAVAGSVTQVLQKAFEGSHIAGTISGFKALETVGKDAFRNSYIDYIPYDPSQDEEEPVEEPVEEPAEEPVNEQEEPAGETPSSEQPSDEQNKNNDDQNAPVNEQEEVIDEQNNNTDEQEVVIDEQNEDIDEQEEIAVADSNEEAAPIEEEALVADAAPEVGIITAAADNASAADNAVETAAIADSTPVANPSSIAKMAKAARVSMALTSVEDNAAPMAAADNATISDADVPMADTLADAPLGAILGGMALAILMAITSIAAIRGRRVDEE